MSASSPELSARVATDDTSLGTWRGDRWATIAIWVVILYTAIRNVAAAAAKPFWYDELCTVAVAGQPNWSSMWKAFGQAEDSGTPVFSILEHFCSRLLSNQEIAYRLPSIVGFGCVLWCLFVFLKTRFGATIALPCSILPTLTLLYHPYAVEARGYTAVVACVAIALVCYQRAERPLWTLLFGVSVVLAGAFHYYGFFAFFPFGLAELTILATRKKIRWGIWLGLLAGFVPIAVSWSHLVQIKKFYGTHFWGEATFTRIVSVYGSLLSTSPPIAIAIVATLAALAFWMTFTPELVWPGERRESYADLNEPVLALGFLGIVVVEFVVAKLAHGTLVDRYALAVALGLSVATAYLARSVGRRGIGLLTVFLIIAFGSQEGYFWFLERRHVGKLESPASPIEDLAGKVQHNDLPVVISDGHQYVQFAYYASPELSKRFAGLVDHEQAIVYAGNDSVDLQMYALRLCLPMQVYQFPEFAREHASFLLYSNGESFDWWPQRLLHDGYLLQFLAADASGKVYLVERGTG